MESKNPVAVKPLDLYPLNGAVVPFQTRMMTFDAKKFIDTTIWLDSIPSEMRTYRLPGDREPAAGLIIRALQPEDGSGHSWIFIGLLVHGNQRALVHGYLHDGHGSGTLRGA